MNAKDSRSRTQRKVNLAESYGKKWIRNYSPNRGVYFRIEEEVSSFHSGQEYQSLVLFSHDSNLIRGTNVRPSVSQSVCLSVCQQYVKIAYKQQSPVIHESHPF